jgi:hypothetical protein
MKRVVGEEVFGGFAFGYLQQYPSRSYTLNELGRRFPQFLEATRPAPRSEPGAPASLPPDWPEFLVELARLEWGIYEVFDGPGLESKPPLGANRLKALGLNQWAAARLEPAPCLKLLRHRFPLNEFYSRARRISAEETPGMPPSREEWLALTRRDYVVRRHALERGEFELLSALCKGATVGEAIERVAGEAGDAEARWADALSRWFQRWLAEGFFAGLLGENGT